jgi:molybdopterin-guanine dinucleotide biosynthesis protein A
MRFKKYNLPVISDSIENFAGPLAGVLSGLDWASERGYKNIVTVAADTPFFPRNLVYELNKKCNEQNAPIGLAATLCLINNRNIRHPTFGFWSVNLRENLRSALNAGVRKVVAWTEVNNGIDIVFKESTGESFFNVNTKEDLSKAINQYGSVSK